MEEGEMFSNICVGFYKYWWRVSKALDFSILYTTNPYTNLELKNWSSVASQRKAQAFSYWKDHNMTPKQWISIRNIIIYLEIKFYPNRRNFVFWRPFSIQYGRHSIPKWSPFVLLPVNIHFHWNLFIFEFLTIYFYYFYSYIGGHFEMAAILEKKLKKEHNFEWWSIFVSSFKWIRCTVSV